MKTLALESFGLQSMTDFELIDIDGGDVDKSSFAYQAGYYTGKFCIELGVAITIVTAIL